MNQALTIKLNASHRETILGSMAVVVDPLDNEAKAFYRKYHFIDLSYENKMFMPMNTIIQIF